jgi:integrase
MQRKNEARWIESRQRWQINVQAEGERRTFTSSVPGSKGKIAAEKKADKWLSTGSVNENTKVTVLLDMFYESLKDRTAYGYYNAFNNFSGKYIKPIIGSKKIGRLTEGDIQDVIDKAYTNSKLAKKPLQNLRGFLSAFLKWCRKHKYTTLMPEEIIIPSSAKRSCKTILDVNSLEILFTVDMTEFRTVKQPDPFIWAYRFAVVSGLRPGELVGLRNADIKDGILSIGEAINDHNEVTQGKNENAKRAEKLSKIGLWILQQQADLLKQSGIISKYVFPDVDGDYIRQSRFRKRWKRYCIVNGIESAQTPYELRHTFVSVNDEMPDYLKKMVVGHSKNMDTTGTYGHKKAGDLDKAAGYIDEAFSKYVKIS